MALASATWEDFPVRRSVLPSAGSRRSLAGALAASLALAVCVVAAVPVLHRLQDAGTATPYGSPVSVAAARSQAPAGASRSWLETNAADFLRDSLLLTRRCEVGCAPVRSEIAQAEKLGRFTHAGNFTAPGGLPLQQRFGLRAAPKIAVTVTPPVPEPAPEPAAVPAPVRIAPTVVVPLAPPTPAPRADRPAEATAALAPAEQPRAPAVPAPPGRVASVAPGPVFGRNDGVAVYDISAATVYMPNGERLEAHSGLGPMVDNPRYVDRRNVGPTPPGTYDLQALGGLFYGVEALRMVPTSGVNTFGRDGFLTHSYMLRGRPAQSNGCVVFPNYARFLEAYKRGHVKRLVVVPSLKQAPLRMASADTGK